jgi:hypothetical protein
MRSGETESTVGQLYQTQTMNEYTGVGGARNVTGKEAVGETPTSCKSLSWVGSQATAVGSRRLTF